VRPLGGNPADLECQNPVHQLDVHRANSPGAAAGSHVAPPRPATTLPCHDLDQLDAGDDDDDDHDLDADLVGPVLSRRVPTVTRTSPAVTRRHPTKLDVTRR
jgi:hypothetical protein